MPPLCLSRFAFVTTTSKDRVPFLFASLGSVMAAVSDATFFIQYYGVCTCSISQALDRLADVTGNTLVLQSVPEDMPVWETKRFNIPKFGHDHYVSLDDDLLVPSVVWSVLASDVRGEPGDRVTSVGIFDAPYLGEFLAGCSSFRDLQHFLDFGYEKRDARHCLFGHPELVSSYGFLSPLYCAPASLWHSQTIWDQVVAKQHTPKLYLRELEATYQQNRIPLDLLIGAEARRLGSGEYLPISFNEDLHD